MSCLEGGEGWVPVGIMVVGEMKQKRRSGSVGDTGAGGDL